MSSSAPMQPVEQIDFNELSDLKVIGKGSFGVVYKCQLKGRWVAVKKIDTDAELKSIQNEKEQLRKVSHPNIIQLYGECIKPVCLVIEYAEYGSLYNVLYGNDPRYEYTAAHALSWALQTAQGVAFLHGYTNAHGVKVPILHRDLKPPNLLLFDGGTLLKICDFGTVCEFHSTMTNNKGSVLWMAPEVFVGNRYNEKCDVYSWAIILWQVLTRQKPFEEMKEYQSFAVSWAAALNGKRPKLIVDCPLPIEKLMTTCWQKDAKVRPSMEKVVKVMTRLCELYPGADIPLVLSSPDQINLHNQEVIDPIYEENTENDEPDIFPVFLDSKSALSPTIVNDIMPLKIDTDPNPWEFGGESDDILMLDKPKTEIGQLYPNADCPSPLTPKASPRPSKSNRITNHIDAMEDERPPALVSAWLPNVSPIANLPKQNLPISRPTPPPRRLPAKADVNQFSSQQNLNQYQNNGDSDIKTHGAAHPVAGHRRSSSYGSTSDFRDKSNIVILPEPKSVAPEAIGRNRRYDFENAYLMLEPNLQPIPALVDIPESLRIFNQHKQLALEYFQAESEIKTLLHLKADLETKLEHQGLRPEEFYTELRRRQSENESLQKFYKKLRTQLGHLRGDESPGHLELLSDDNKEPGFVTISRMGEFSNDNDS